MVLKPVYLVTTKGTFLQHKAPLKATPGHLKVSRSALHDPLELTEYFFLRSITLVLVLLISNASSLQGLPSF